MTAQDTFSKMGEMFKNMPKFDKEAMMNSHRKNMDALTEANKLAMEVMKSITQLQSQYMRQAFEDFTTIMKDMMGTANAKDPFKSTVEQHSNHVKDHVSKAMNHSSNITSALAKTQKEIFEIMHNRYTEGMKELGAMPSKGETKH